MNCAPLDEEVVPSVVTESPDFLKKDEKDVEAETLESLADLGDVEETDLPILPPIILIDFTNGTNLTSEEKTKRTINGNLGYGFQPNNLFSGKYNYYFPAGKTGTTVSIEESISPFLPTTIIEKENVNPSQSQSYAFGQRIKLQKTTSSNDNYQSYSPQRQNFASYTTPKPAIDFQQYNRYPTGLGSYKNSGQSYRSFSTPSSTPVYSTAGLQPHYQPLSSGLTKTYNPQIQNYESLAPTRFQNFPQRQEISSYSTPAPINYHPSQSQTTVLSPVSSGTPKYSYENGIKYEHKIVWRYPNGMVSDIAPNSYPDYSVPPKATLTQSFQNSGPRGFSAEENSGTGIYSQKPATFPQDAASDGADPKPSQFVSSASISGATGSYQTASPAPSSSQKYSFQNPYSVVGEINSQLQSHTPAPGQIKATYENPKTLSNYPVDSPEAEFSALQGYPNREIFGASGDVYRGQTLGYEEPQNPAPESSNSKLQPSIQISKYSPQVQQYLKKALGLDENGNVKNKEYAAPGVTDYSSLLDYNPSISQYIGNPSSILNAQPTFIQAGNSLIPVIILRVDGVPPIQPNLTPNINLKALLQKYLTQYAQTVTSLNQGGNGGFGQEYASEKLKSDTFDLRQLTRGLGQLRSNDPNFKQNFVQNFAQSIAQSTQTYNQQPSSFTNQRNYEEIKKEEPKYATRSPSESTPRKMKVKNVQIIEDPRFTSYKVKN